MLVYYGACLDVYPLVALGSWKKRTVRDYVYVDGLPNSKYCSSTCATVELMMEEIERTFNMWSSGVVTGRTVVIPDKNWQLSLGFSTLHYFVNTMTEDVISGHVPEQLKELLSRAQHLMVKGYLPAEGVLAAMPAAARGELTMYYAGVMVDLMNTWGTAYPMHRTGLTGFGNHQGRRAGEEVEGLFDCCYDSTQDEWLWTRLDDHEDRSESDDAQ